MWFLKVLFPPIFFLLVLASLAFGGGGNSKPVGSPFSTGGAHDGADEGDNEEWTDVGDGTAAPTPNGGGTGAEEGGAGAAGESDGEDGDVGDNVEEGDDDDAVAAAAGQDNGLPQGGGTHGGFHMPEYGNSATAYDGSLFPRIGLGTVIVIHLMLMFSGD